MEPVISVILPMFNEEAVLPELVRRLEEELGKVELPFELVCVNDGSTDETGKLLDGLTRTRTNVVVIHLSRNFGKEAAMAAGLDHARGKAVLLIDADLQHPPELIPKMVEGWQRGADVVSGVKSSRGDESLSYRLLAGLFNTMMGQSLGGGGRPGQRSFHGQSDFKLLDRQVVEAIKQCPERHRFFRGLVAWVGFRVVEIPFEVQARAAGVTKWSPMGLVRYSLQNLLSFSAAPLRTIALSGFSLLSFTTLLAIWTLYRWVRGDSLAGFPTVILLQLIFGSVLLMSLGVISLYLAEMYDELKRRPVYLYRVPDLDRDRPPRRRMDTNSTLIGVAPPSAPPSVPPSSEAPSSSDAQTSSAEPSSEAESAPAPRVARNTPRSEDD